MRRIRDWVEKGLAVLGVVIVLVPVVTLADSLWQIGAVVVGLLLIEAGVWNLAKPLLPEERRYSALRDEVDHFLEDVRELNDRAVEGDADGVDDVRVRLRERVDGLVEAAGQEDG
jgi:hypothetical protein